MAAATTSNCVALTGDHFEGRLATTATARSWRTVVALLEMASA